MPQRYRKAQDQYQALVDEIETVERLFLDNVNGAGDASDSQDPRKEAARLKKLFDIARADQQANYPDLYVSTGTYNSKETKDLTKELEDAKTESSKMQADLLSKIQALTADLQGKAPAADAKPAPTVAHT